MIIDAESLALANAIEALLDEAPAGEIKPELMESVLEISTAPCRNTAEAGEQLRNLRRHVSDAAERRDLLIGSAGTHPFARWEDQRIVAPAALPRPDLRAALRRPAGDHLRPARPRRHRRRREGHPRRQRDARARPDPARAVGQLAVLAR